MKNDIELLVLKCILIGCLEEKPVLGLIPRSNSN